jgi:hypothetical protein
MDEADKSIEAYDALYKSIPSIGFLNRKKRVVAYLKVTKLAQQLVDDQVISEDNAYYLLSILARKCSVFQKTAMMAALNLEKIDRKLIKPVGFKYANEMRSNLHMLPIDD